MALVIFDLDGTLVDSVDDLCNAVNAARGYMGLPPLEHGVVASYVGNGAPVLIRRAMGADATEQQIEEALAFFLSYYREHMLDQFNGGLTTLKRGSALPGDHMSNVSRDGRAIREIRPQEDDTGIRFRW